ncbi:MAG: hypothetical protein M3Q34_01110 [bacterium]|nr:hypothetical protein [bacterium]
MSKIIQKLRAKPEAEKRHILHISTFVCGVLLLALWGFSLGNSFRNPDLQTKAQQDIQPFKDLSANVINGYNIISDQPTNDNKTE